MTAQPSSAPINMKREREEDVVYKSKFVVFDVETTGLNVDKDRVVQLAMIQVVSDGTEGIFNHYFNPCMRREEQLEAYKIHKISPDSLLNEKHFKAYAEKILCFLQDVSFLVGHNVRFDWNFLANEFRRLDDAGNDMSQQNNSWLKRLHSLELTLVDTFKMSIIAFPDLTNYKLATIGKHLKIETVKQPVISYSVSSPKKKKSSVVKIETKQVEDGLHDAMIDILVTKEIFGECTNEMLKCIRDEKHRELVKETIPSDRRFTYTMSEMKLIDEQTQLNDKEKQLCKIRHIAQESMSMLQTSRGKQLKQLSPRLLSQEIEHLSKKYCIDNQRDMVLRESVLLEKVESQKSTGERNFQH